MKRGNGGDRQKPRDRGDGETEYKVRGQLEAARMISIERGKVGERCSTREEGARALAKTQALIRPKRGWRSLQLRHVAQPLPR